MFRIIISFYIGLTLFGCASGRPTSFESKDESPTDFVERMSLDLSKKFSYPDIVSSKKLVKSQYFDEFYVEFTPFIVGGAGVEKSIVGYCAGLEGSIYNGACIKENEFLFYSVVETTGRSTRDGYELSVTMVSPNGSGDTSKFYGRIKQLGYQTDAEKKEMRDAAINEWSSLAEQARLESFQKKQQVSTSEIGTKICQWNQDFLYVGYIEAKEKENIKILLVDAAYKGDPLIKPGGFSQKVLWDNAQNWEVCW